MNDKVEEASRKALSDHLREVVRLGLSGRDSADLPERPYRLIFAGVLQPPRSESSTRNIDASAIGLDFRVLHLRQAEMTVDIAFALYYPIFPPFREASRTVSGSTGSPAIVNIVPWHRRKSVKLVGLPIAMRESGFDLAAANKCIADAIEAARQEMLDDPNVWLAPAGRSAIDFSTASLQTPEMYASAIADLASGTAETLPVWRAQLVAEVQDDLNSQYLHLQVLLANTAERPADYHRRIADWNIYDASFRLVMPSATIVPYEFLLAPEDYRLESKLVARGINCSVSEPFKDEAVLETQTLPVYEQPYYRTRQQLDQSFSTLSGPRFLTALAEIEADMQRYADDWRKFIARSSPEMSVGGLQACEEDRGLFEAEIARFRLGMDCLHADPKLARAFVLMNEAFGMLAGRSAGKLRAWRLFQIGFIVSQLASVAVRRVDDVTEPALAERMKKAHASVGILWFPTGGGKTEAYLGLIATSLIYDRLRGKTRGLNTWMRFPLRMLSLQQLERMARVIAVLNEMRTWHADLGVGDEFAIGYFIGKSASPNRVTAGDAELLSKDPARRSKLRQLMKCPHCGARVTIEWLRESWRLAHVCTDSTCFSNVELSRGDRKGTLPLFIVDDEIYRYLPAVLVGTVDKLAGAVLRREVANMTTGVDATCPSHGYLSYGKCIERTCERKPIEYRKLAASTDPGPALLVQDEFHLLRAELGVFAGHYEGLLQTILGQDGSLPPKILAATATIEAYSSQSFQIYLKEAIRYPESGWALGESCYATSTPPMCRRTYVGVLGHTRTVEDVALRIESLYLAEIRRLAISRAECAETMALGDRDPAIVDTVLRLYDFILTYVMKKAHAGSIKDKQRIVEEHLARFGYGPVECFILTGDNSSEEIAETLDRIERELDGGQESRLELLVATNLISHGVDLERINCMIVAGMPSHYAEYVQSSSRCARSHPGTVFVCFRSSDARESSQYQSFFAMHQHMDRLIEPVAVNRFASFAPRKTVPGMLVGYCMTYASPKLFRNDKTSKPLDDMKALQTAMGYARSPGGNMAQTLKREDLVAAIYASIGVDRVRPPALAADVERLRETVAVEIEDNLARIGRSMDQYVGEALTCLTSFRDIDEGVRFSTLDSMELLLRLEA